MSSSVSATSSSTASTQSSSSTTSALFQASGIASGLDTGLIVDALIAADSVQLNALKQKQSDYQVQISTLGTLVSQLQELKSAAASLATNGVVSIKPTSTYGDFTTSGSAAAESSYTIQVNNLATAAKMRSASFTSAQDAAVVPDGTLQFSIEGTATASIDATGKTLADVAEAINQNIPGLTASVISTSTGYYMNVARTSTGYATTAEVALTVVSDPGFGLASQQSAENASLTIDGLPVSRQSNTVSDVISGVTLNLRSESGVSNTVNFAADASETETALETFVDAYNELAGTLKSQLVTDPSQSYGGSILSHSVTSTIEREMQSLLSTVVVPSGKVRTLADLGLQLERDGSLYLNKVALTAAVKNSPSAVNSIFSQATTGMSAKIKTLVDRQINKTNGTLILQEDSLEASITKMDDQKARIEAYLDAERARLVIQFTNMETLISGFKAATSYLTQISNLKISE